MSVTYWVIPLVSRTPWTFGAERIACERELFDSFRAKVQASSSSLHLLMFKAELLLSEDDELCGVEEPPELDFHVAGDLIPDVRGLSVSHCAEAFIERLPDARDWRATVERLLALPDGTWTERETDMLHAIQRWSTQSHDVIVLREE